MNSGDVGSIGDVGNISEIAVIDISEAFQDFDVNALNDALSNNDTAIANLQNEISGNDTLNNALSGNNIDVSDVVAVDNTNDGTLILYTNN
jgi:hypothetical protein